MPELPEVEVLRRSLESRLVGDVVRRVEVRSPALREPLDPEDLERHLTGRRVERLGRRAKYLLVDVAGGSTLVVHLGMSGQLTLVPAETPPAPHEHLAFHLAGGSRLRLVDPRRFGNAFALATEELASDRHFVHLGVEPLSEELSGSFLRQVARGRRGPVKAFLMDARVMFGVATSTPARPCSGPGSIRPGRWRASLGSAGTFSRRRCARSSETPSRRAGPRSTTSETAWAKAATSRCRSRCTAGRESPAPAAARRCGAGSRATGAPTTATAASGDAPAGDRAAQTPTLRVRAGAP